MDDPTTSEAGALAELSLQELGTAVDGIHTIQRAISERVFRLVGLGVGPAAKPVKVVYDAITDGVYSAIGHTFTTAAPVAGKAFDGPTAGTLSDQTGGARVLAALQGLIGDKLHEQGSALATTMSVRVDGRAVSLDPASVRAAYPTATGDVVVFLHGLMETEAFWALGNRPTYSQRLGSDIDITGVEIRYNTGLHISDNGVLLSELLDQLVAGWPVPVRTISLVGHSMGGLVIRSACAVADRSWVDRVRTVVTLGTPHTGAPLEKVVHFGSAALSALPETRPLGNLLRRRSTGIRDLRFGSLDERDWRDRDADALRAEAQTDVPLLDGVSYYCVSATLARTPANPIGWVLGDGLVQVRSAQGRSKKRDMGFQRDNRLHLPEANHFTLLNDERIYDRLRIWLS
ncbi:alpha/beta hydrolase [Mycobacterium sp. CBMA 234]|uniref:esterase/lipase family protein n=1 Tax=Mycolicibacterium sp. CBMA 234 TaxID=1918495 RepID=UPI0012DDB29D|nr:alpha/beta fold hydrolase [Mycolicibacterium sp. CBMA 234]MUL65732.1 alpha/beta hydrolase [Mycolicibacterium sp. CBMA 234]